MRRSSQAAFVAAVLPALLPRAAEAQPSGQDVATAQALFDDGKRLMLQGKYEEGCPKLVESQRLDPGGGTILAIALCHEGQGKTATAWADFSVALGQARQDGRADREATALEHIAALEPKLTKVRVSVAQKVEGIEVHRDGALVGEAQWGTPLPVDPGAHAFEASAPGKRPWSTTIVVEGPGKTVDVRVPALVDAEPSPTVTPAMQAPAATPAAAPGPRDAHEERHGSSQVTWAAIVGGTGVVATTVGVVFGLSASSKWSDAERACPAGRCTSAVDAGIGEDAGKAADLSTVFFTVGAVGLVAGAVLYFTAPSGKATSAGRRLLEGRF